MVLRDVVVFNPKVVPILQGRFDGCSHSLVRASTDHNLESKFFLLSESCNTLFIMAKENHLNVYKGPDSVRQYFDPESSPPLPLVEIPECLNPYRQDGVRIYAKMMSMHPANNVKSMPGK